MKREQVMFISKKRSISGFPGRYSQAEILFAWKIRQNEINSVESRPTEGITSANRFYETIFEMSTANLYNQIMEQHLG